MKRFVLLHYGFEPPTPEVVEAWQAWFREVEPYAVEHVGIGPGRELSHDGARDLPMGPDALTGYSVLEAESLEQAEALAAGNPWVHSIRIHQVREG